MNNLQDKKDEMEGTMNWLFMFFGVSLMIYSIMGLATYLLFGYFGYEVLRIIWIVAIIALIFKTISDIYKK